DTFRGRRRPRDDSCVAKQPPSGSRHENADASDSVGAGRRTTHIARELARGRSELGARRRKPEEHPTESPASHRTWLLVARGQVPPFARTAPWVHRPCSAALVRRGVEKRSAVHPPRNLRKHLCRIRSG